MTKYIAPHSHNVFNLINTLWEYKICLIAFLSSCDCVYTILVHQLSSQIFQLLQLRLSITMSSWHTYLTLIVTIEIFVNPIDTIKKWRTIAIVGDQKYY